MVKKKQICVTHFGIQVLVLFGLVFFVNMRNKQLLIAFYWLLVASYFSSMIDIG